MAPAAPGPASALAGVVCVVLGLFGGAPAAEAPSTPVGVVESWISSIYAGLACVGLCTVAAAWAWVRGHWSAGSSRTGVHIANSVTLHTGRDDAGLPAQRSFIARRGGGRLE